MHLATCPADINFYLSAMSRYYLLFIAVFLTPFSYPIPYQSMNLGLSQPATSTFDPRDPDLLQDVALDSANQVGSDPESEEQNKHLLTRSDDSETGSDSSISPTNIEALENSCPSGGTHTHSKLRTRTDHLCSWKGDSGKGDEMAESEENNKKRFCPFDKYLRLCCVGLTYGWDLLQTVCALVDKCQFCKLSCVDFITSHNNISAQMIVRQYVVRCRIFAVKTGWT